MCCHVLPWYFVQFVRNLRNLSESSLHRQARPTSSRVLLGPRTTHRYLGLKHAQTLETDDGDPQAYGILWNTMGIYGS
jgi:hypothetical protein